MGARRQRATTSSQIIEKDYNTALKKAKARYRTDKRYRIDGCIDKFYILKEQVYYFVEGSVLPNEEYLEKWQFNNKTNKWERQ